MKTAISIDDALLNEADQTARQLGVSRSRLFALAVDDFLKKQRSERMLRRLNEVYSIDIDSTEKRLLRGIKTKVRRAVKDRW